MSALVVARSLALIAVARAELAGSRLLRKLAVGSALIAVGLLGLGYLSLAAFLALAAQYGTAVAGMLVGAACLVIALAGALALSVREGKAGF